MSLLTFAQLSNEEDEITVALAELQFVKEATCKEMQVAHVAIRTTFFEAPEIILLPTLQISQSGYDDNILFRAIFTAMIYVCAIAVVSILAPRKATSLLSAIMSRCQPFVIIVLLLISIRQS